MFNVVELFIKYIHLDKFGMDKIENVVGLKKNAVYNL